MQEIILIKRKLKKFVDSVFTKITRKQSRINRVIYRLCLSFTKAYENVSYDFQKNGERLVLDGLAKLKPKTIFDVGANVGDWSLMAGAICNTAKIHVFEIVPQTFRLVSENLSENQQYILNNVGLSSNEAIVEIYQDETKNTHATMLKSSIGRGGFIPIKARVISGDEYCRQHNIMHIDFLKVDVEGAENSVLEGFERMLSNAKISMIQFEYTELNIDSRFLLKDFYECLEAYGYQIGKLYPYGVHFKKYSYDDEDFKGPNFIAVHESCDRLIKFLST